MPKKGRGGRRNQKLNRLLSSSSTATPPVEPTKVEPTEVEPTGRTLPEDIINEILVRTPVKSLVRFRCVSKSWLLRTLHPKFISMHLKHNTMRHDKQLICNIYDRMTSSKLIAFVSLHGPVVPVCRSDVDSADKPDYPRKINVDDFFKEMVLAGSINGIMCLSINGMTCFSKYKEMKGRSVALWNPAINMWKPIRFLERKSGFDRLDVMSVGLGFDKDAEDYKIVRIVPVVRPPHFQEYCWSRVEVYSAKHDFWMDLEEEGLVPFWPKLPNCNFIINGCPYWVGADHLPGEFTQFNPIQNEMLASLDPCTGSYKKVWYPRHVKNVSTRVNPLKWKDSLALLIQSPGESPNSTVDMYGLDMNTENWTKIYTIVEHQFEGLRIPQCLATGEIVLETWKGYFLHAKRTPYFWNPETSDSFIKKRGFATIVPLWYESYTHVESLVSVKGMVIIGKEDKKNGKDGRNKKKTKPLKKNWYVYS